MVLNQPETSQEKMVCFVEELAKHRSPLNNNNNSNDPSTTLRHNEHVFDQIVDDLNFEPTKLNERPFCIFYSIRGRLKLTKPAPVQHR